MSRGSVEHRQKKLVSARSKARSFETSCRDSAQAPVKTSWPVAPSAAEVNANPSVRIGRLFASAAASLSERHEPDDIAAFLLRCAFTMFLSSVDIIPPHALSCAVQSGTLEIMWAALFMEAPDNENIECRDALLAHDGQEPPGDAPTGIFASMTALPLDDAAKRALVEADDCDWASVDLSIFGALVEASFSPKTRHRLGVHYTPREYVMRLVGPTIEEPMREEWEAAKGEESAQPLLDYHAKLSATRVLDPACGSGNFLIVALETLHGIEDDVFRELARRGIERPTARVSPRQMLGIEINPRACEVCKLVLQMCDLRRKRALAGDLDGSRSE